MKNAALALLLFVSPALAQESRPMDMSTVEPDLLDGFFGKWQVQNAEGDRTCDVKLLRDETIGGMAVEIADDCAATFPIMGEITAWRLYENWEIVFADATRKERIRFSTPDAAYIATIAQPSDEISPAP